MCPLLSNRLGWRTFSVLSQVFDSSSEGVYIFGLALLSSKVVQHKERKCIDATVKIKG